MAEVWFELKQSHTRAHDFNNCSSWYCGPASIPWDFFSFYQWVCRRVECGEEGLWFAFFWALLLPAYMQVPFCFSPTHLHGKRSFWHNFHGHYPLRIKCLRGMSHWAIPTTYIYFLHTTICQELLQECGVPWWIKVKVVACMGTYLSGRSDNKQYL